MPFLQGKEPPKMYATWNKNETKEIDMLHVKLGKPYPVETSVLL